MTRELLQQALDALEGTDLGLHIETVAALRSALAAPQAEPVGYISKTGHGTYFRETITPELAALEHGGRKMWTPVVAAPPAAPAPAVPRHVRKIGGSFQHTGTVVAEFKTLAGEPRIVLEFDAPVAGMLHVYRPDQVEPCEQAHGIGGGK